MIAECHVNCLVETDAQAYANAEFIAEASPATVLALLDELEAAKKRIAELEAREIKPAKGEVLVVVNGKGILTRVFTMNLMDFEYCRQLWRLYFAWYYYHNGNYYHGGYDAC